MRVILLNGNHRVITEGGNLEVQERHTGEWWTTLIIELKVLADAYSEYVRRNRRRTNIDEIADYFGVDRETAEGMAARLGSHNRHYERGG